MEEIVSGSAVGQEPGRELPGQAKEEERQGRMVFDLDVLDDEPVTEAFLAGYQLQVAKAGAQDGPAEPHKPAKLTKEMIVPPEWLAQGDQEAAAEHAEDVQDFICAAPDCGYIVSEPMHCESCDRYLCKDCLNADLSCPVCNDPTIKCLPMSNFARRHLEQFQFKCPNSEGPKPICQKTEPMGYREATQHLTQCLGETYYCPYNCAQEVAPVSEEDFERKLAVRGYEMKEHFKKCPAYPLTCQTCQMTERRANIGQHDCLEALKKEALQQKLKVLEKKETFGIDFERYEPKCNNNHTLLAYRGFPYQHDPVRCNVCGERNLHDMDLFYHCRACKYDLCKACFLSRAKILRSKLKAVIHSCELTFEHTSQHSRCDAAGQHELSNVCLHGQTDFGHGRNTQRWRCRACDFDACMKCVLKYAYTPVEDIPEREGDYAYFVLSSPPASGNDEEVPKMSVNRYLNRETAEEMFERLQIHSLKKRKEEPEGEGEEESYQDENTRY